MRSEAFGPGTVDHRTGLSEKDVGKLVINGCGEEIGRIVEFSEGSAHVNPEPNLADTVLTPPGWNTRRNEDTYRLNDEQVTAITDDEIRLRF